MSMTDQERSLMRKAFRDFYDYVRRNPDKAPEAHEIIFVWGPGAMNTPREEREMSIEWIGRKKRLLELLEVWKNARE